MALTNETSTNETDAVAGGAAPAADSKAKVGRKGKAETKSAADVAGAHGRLRQPARLKSKAKPAARLPRQRPRSS